MAKLLDLFTTYEDLRAPANKKDSQGVAPEQTNNPPAPVTPPLPTSSDVASVEGPTVGSSIPAADDGRQHDVPASAGTPNEIGPEALYELATSGVSAFFVAATAGDDTAAKLQAAGTELEKIALSVVRSTRSDRGLLRKAMDDYPEGEWFVVPHSVNVSILAVELGREMELAHDKLLALCLAGLVHDVGSVRLPDGLLSKTDHLTTADWDAIRARPTHGHHTIRKLGGRSEYVARVAVQVHERLDGSGYPEGLADREILPEARILGAADFFESFTHTRPYKTTAPGTASHAIQVLMHMVDKFGTATLKALVGSIGLFPIGSYVRISSGEIGRVVDVTKENPMRPEIQVLLTAEHHPPHNPRLLNLLANPHMYVSGALTAADLQEAGLAPSLNESALPTPESSQA